jgi:hypothetical protein
LTRRNVELKFRKIARTLGMLHANLLAALPPSSRFQLDEMITFEQNRRTRPLTLPLLIEGGTFFVVAGESAPIRPSGKKTKRTMAAIAEDERRCGQRPHLERECLQRVLGTLVPLVRGHATIQLSTDLKPLYRTLAGEIFGERLRHEQTSGRLPRNVSNPLFPINLTNAMARYLNGRLRRRSWLCSKQHRYLNAQLHYFIAYRNYVRARTNHDPLTPATALGLLDGTLRFEQCLAWRQDWGARSLHPAHADPETIASVRERSIEPATRKGGSIRRMTPPTSRSARSPRSGSPATAPCTCRTRPAPQR